MVGWLTGYSNRFKLTVDSGDIDAALTHFPLRVHLSSSSGLNSFDATDIFDEIGANNLKLAVTKDDGTTECYVEIDNWDSSAETADLWVSKSDLVISDSADTVLYLYYDSSVANNTTYVGVTDSVVAENVWDANFKLVCHMSDATTSTVKDSTSNDNDGTKKGANEPIEATGKIGEGQTFDGVDDVTSHPDVASLQVGTKDVSILAWVFPTGSRAVMMGVIGAEGGGLAFGMNTATRNLRVTKRDVADAPLSGLGISADTWTHVAMTFDNSEAVNNLIYYKNGVSATKSWDVDFTAGASSNNIGCREPNDANSLFIGSLDEIQVYEGILSSAWVGASYETQRDHLITYGVDYGTTGESLYYYRDRFWTHLPKPEPVPDVPDPSTVDWSIGAIEKAKLDRDAEELLGLNKKLRKIREQEWLDHVRNTE